jgi:hypothetical protein
MKTLRFLRKFLSGYQLDDDDNSEILFERHRESFKIAVLLVRIYYWAALFVFAPLAAGSWINYLTNEPVNLLWPVFWVQFISLTMAVNIIWAFVILTLIAAAIFPNIRWLRLLMFIALFLFIAFINSFGKIDHGFLAWLAVDFIFVFLPARKWSQLEFSIRDRQFYLTIFWAAQALILLFYSMSGWWKFYMVVQQFKLSQIHFLHPEGLAYIIARQLHWINSETVLGPIILEYPFLGWPLAITVVYLELFAIVAAFRPALHRLWGISLALFHLGNILAMLVFFNESILLLGLLLVNSPFHPPQLEWKKVVLQLPLINGGFRLLSWLSGRDSRFTKALGLQVKL